MPDLRSRLQDALSDRYRIERELGRGGAGVVFLAEDLKHGRRVAIKVLRPELAESLTAERFLREIRIVAGLNHPNILSLIDSGTAEGLLYYVSFYVEGESLRDRLDRERQLPVDEAVRIISEAADALAYAHDAGVVHRDVKPENILLESGHAVVCDFGIASAIEEAGGERLTQTGLVVGTPEYMSPEQAAGDEDLDGRTDVYGLGCVLYEMLAGGPPYTGSTPQAILARKVMEPLPSLRVVRDTVPPAVEGAVARALAKVPADRFQTPREFAAALQDRATAAPAQAPSLLQRLGRRWLAVGAVVAVMLAAGLYVLTSADASGPTHVTFSQLTAQPRVEDSPSLSHDGEWVVYAGEGSGSRDVFLQSVGGRTPINLTEDSPADDFQPAFSPDGERIAFRSSRDGGGLFVMGRTGEAVRRVTRAGFNPAWSPDGTRLVYADESVELHPLNWERVSALWTVNVDGGAPSRVYEGDGVQPTWSPDGRRIAFTARMGRSRDAQMDIWTIPVEGGEPTRVTSDLAADWSPVWSADGRWIYFSSERGGSMNLWRVEVDQGAGEATARPQPITTPASAVAHPTLSADGRLIAYSAYRHDQNVQQATLDWREGTVADLTWLTNGSRQWSSPDPSPDGSRVAFYSMALPEGDLYVAPAGAPGQPRQVTRDEAIDRLPRFSPDGEWISYFSNRREEGVGPLELWAVHPDGSDNRRLTDGGGVGLHEWAPDGSRIAANVHAGSTTVVFDPGRPWEEQDIETLPTPDSAVGNLVVNDWSPDGRRLAGFVAPLTDDGIIVYDLETRAYSRLTDFGQWPVWMPDSRHLLFVTGGSEFWILDADTGEHERIYASRIDVLGPPRVTTDGTTIVYSRRVSEADVWLAALR